MRFLTVFFVLTLAGCWSADPNEVVVYCALDREFAEPILNEFTKETGVVARAVYDVESSKTVGLVERIIQEGNRPACDVFWNNEALHTLRLDGLGLFAEYESPSGRDISAAFRSPRGTWHGFAARARVLIVNTQRVAAAERPMSVADLANPKWRGRCAIARPLFGTTATHVACWYATLGRVKAEAFLTQVKANEVRVLSGNKQVAQAVAAGEVVFGLTDTDDAIIELEAGRPVTIVYPDQGADQPGTLFIPNTLAIVQGGPNTERAKRLVDYVLQPKVEAALAAGPSAQIPLRAATTNEGNKKQLRVETPATIRPMQVDFAAAAKQWESAAKFLRDDFLAP